MVAVVNIVFGVRSSRFRVQRFGAGNPAAGYRADGSGWGQRVDPKNEVDKNLPPNPKVVYKEGVFLGYRWYDSRKLPVRYAFGHGLSYTAFADKNMQIKTGPDGITVHATITNTGSRSGSETVQLYIGAVKPAVERPERELKAFAKIQLEPGESKPIEFHLTPVALSYYDVQQKNWRVDPGTFIVDPASSSRDIRLSDKINWTQELHYQRPTDHSPLNR